MNGIDVNLFQFDYFASWSAFFMNQHGHTYARYGMRESGKNQNENLMSKEGFRVVMTQILETHKTEGNKKPPPSKPLLAESLRAMPKDLSSGKKCIHCHHAYQFGNKEMPDFLRRSYPDLPSPESLGMTLDIDLANVVKSVTANSKAAKAGIQVKDRILAINGMRIYSAADVSWLLYQLAPSPILTIELERGGVKKTVKL